jgi:hypothetical protein
MSAAPATGAAGSPDDGGVDHVEDLLVVAAGACDDDPAPSTRARTLCAPSRAAKVRASPSTRTITSEPPLISVDPAGDDQPAAVEHNFTRSQTCSTSPGATRARR